MIIRVKSDVPVDVKITVDGLPADPADVEIVIDAPPLEQRRVQFRLKNFERLMLERIRQNENEKYDNA